MLVVRGAEKGSLSLEGEETRCFGGLVAPLLAVRGFLVETVVRGVAKGSW